MKAYHPQMFVLPVQTTGRKKSRCLCWKFRPPGLQNPRSKMLSTLSLVGGRVLEIICLVRETELLWSSSLPRRPCPLPCPGASFLTLFSPDVPMHAVSFEPSFFHLNHVGIYPLFITKRMLQTCGNSGKFYLKCNFFMGMQHQVSWIFVFALFSLHLFCVFV